MDNTKNYAVIENGVCVNVIVATPEVAHAWGLVDTSEGYGVGDLYDGATWTKKTPIESVFMQITPTNEQLQEQLLILATALAEVYERTVN